MTLAESLDAILRDRERRERRDATGDSYRSHLGAWIKHFGEGKVGGLAIKHNLTALTRAMPLAGVPRTLRGPPS
ncbi:MAG: hypothetical protein JNL08_16275 [Planctomycetes bacterium]|nr:hypothetical protein [Planctomycetota bacterium]